MDAKTTGKEVERACVPEVSFRLELDGRQSGASVGGRSLMSPSGSPGGNISPSTAASGPPVLQKCLSFPRIVTDRPTSWSISPCQSRTYLDACYPQSFLGGSEKSMDPDRLSIIGHAGLLRSMSARTVELECRPEQEQSINSSGSSSRYLSPACDRIGDTPLAGRSTSCPSMAYTETTNIGQDGNAKAPLPQGTAADMRQLLFRQQDKEEDIDLAGEEIDDLPIEPNTDFPDLPAELIDSQRLDTPSLDFKELHINNEDETSKTVKKESTEPTTKKRSLSVSAAPEKDKENSINKTASAAATSGKGKDGAYVNVRDLPRSSMSDAMRKHHIGLNSGGQNMDTNQKCLRWLNTLPAQRS